MHFNFGYGNIYQLDPYIVYVGLLSS